MFRKWSKKCQKWHKKKRRKIDVIMLAAAELPQNGFGKCNWKKRDVCMDSFCLHFFKEK